MQQISAIAELGAEIVRCVIAKNTASGRVLRVITLEDEKTVHNAFLDRNFYKRQQQGKEPK